MFQVPTPPTDNLYKFVAISGVVAVIASLASMVFLQREFSEHAEKRITVQREYAQAVIRQDDERLIAAIKDGDPEVRKAIWDGHQTALRLVADGAEIDASLLEVRKRAGERMAEIATRAAALGMLVSCIGFLLWWFRVQRIQDRILALDLKERELKTLAPSKDGK